MRETLSSGELRTFCRVYLETLDPKRAARAVGAEDGDVLLRKRPVRRELERIRAEREILRQDAVRRLAELAFGRANDAVRLALSPPEARPDPEGLELSAVAEFKATDKGAMEIKFVDRVRALEALCSLLGETDGGGAEEFFRALESAGAEEETP